MEEQMQLVLLEKKVMHIAPGWSVMVYSGMVLR
jgi:hypothetical protein